MSSPPNPPTTNQPNPNPNPNPNPPSILSTFASNPLLSPFLSPDFSSSHFTSRALTSGSAASIAETLQESIRLLHQSLRSQVLARHPALLSQLSSLRDAHSSLSAVRSAVSSLQSSLRRARHDLSLPRRQIRSHTTQLSNLRSAADLLAGCSRFLRLAGKLRDLMDRPADRLDLAKAAEMHREVEVLYEERDLSGISVVEDEIRWLKETGDRLRERAMGAVERGMDERNQNDVWCGLQVFYNLGELRSSVDQLVGRYRVSGVRSVGAAVDAKGVSGAQVGGGRKAGEAVWERMGRCMDELHRVVTAVWQLQSVLAKKRVPFTQVLFLHEVWQVRLICLL